MLKVIIHGFLGSMGQTVVDLCLKNENIEILAGIDRTSYNGQYPFMTYENFSDIKEKADVIIDFSIASAVPELLKYVKATKTPVVLCTTGLSEDTLNQIEEISKEVAIFKSANMSLGINVMTRLLDKVSDFLYNANFDVEIYEKHHKNKVDAPSGTAKLLYDVIEKSINDDVYPTYDRSQVTQKRDKKEIGLTTMRGGSIVGEHTVSYAGDDEVIEITHIAQSRKVFALGAIKAGFFIKDKTNEPKIYNMNDMLDNIF